MKLELGSLLNGWIVAGSTFIVGLLWLFRLNSRVERIDDRVGRIHEDVNYLRDRVDKYLGGE